MSVVATIVHVLSWYLFCMYALDWRITMEVFCWFVCFLWDRGMGGAKREGKQVNSDRHSDRFRQREIIQTGNLLIECLSELLHARIWIVERCAVFFFTPISFSADKSFQFCSFYGFLTVEAYIRWGDDVGKSSLNFWERIIPPSLFLRPFLLLRPLSSSHHFSSLYCGTLDCSACVTSILYR